MVVPHRSLVILKASSQLHLTNLPGSHKKDVFPICLVEYIQCWVHFYNCYSFLFKILNFLHKGGCLVDSGKFALGEEPFHPFFIYIFIMQVFK